MQQKLWKGTFRNVDLSDIKTVLKENNAVLNFKDFFRKRVSDILEKDGKEVLGGKDILIKIYFYILNI
jgi:hypothetical protein